MTHLHQVLGHRVDQWRADGYPSSDYPAIAEIFEWARDDQTGSLRIDLRGTHDSGRLVGSGASLRA